MRMVAPAEISALASAIAGTAAGVTRRATPFPWQFADDIPSGASRRSRMAGKYYEELAIGTVLQHQPGRTVTEADNIWFSCLTMNPQTLHVDFHAAAKAEFGKPLVNSLFTLGVAVGLSVGETTLGTTVGNLGFEKIEFPKPVFHGDTIYSETEIVDKRESRSRPQWGIVTFEHRAKNQHGEIVMRARRQAMMRKRA
jgi:acyl dehydratase